MTLAWLRAVLACGEAHPPAETNEPLASKGGSPTSAILGAAAYRRGSGAAQLDVRLSVHGVVGERASSSDVIAVIGLDARPSRFHFSNLPERKSALRPQSGIWN